MGIVNRQMPLAAAAASGVARFSASALTPLEAPA